MELKCERCGEVGTDGTFTGEMGQSFKRVCCKCQDSRHGSAADMTKCVGCGLAVPSGNIVGYYPWGGVCKVCYEIYPEMKASPLLALVPDFQL
jgi:hypothetical protein